jgi:hypothetical protein
MIFLLALVFNVMAETKMVELGQEFSYQAGEKIVLSNADFSVEVSADPGTKCAVPGFNCGSGYIPPHPKFKMNCSNSNPCPYVFINAQTLSGTAGKGLIESLKKCETDENELCLRSYVDQIRRAEDCLVYPPLIRYFCLQRFSLAIPVTERGLCDLLPENKNPYRRGNCYYDYAVSLKDPTLCEKFKAEDFSQKDRCYNRLSQVLKDKTLCQKISDTKEHNYKQQCLDNEM